MSSPSPHEDLSTEELFRRFAPFVARFLYRLGVGSDGLDDLVQEVFLVVHRRGGYKAGPAKPTSYLATIAAYAASAHRRRQRTEQARASDVEVEVLMSTQKGPVQLLEVNERLELLQSALERLDPDLRATLVLADIEGESCASIAASSGVPAGTVYWRLHEARKRLQRALRAEMAGIPHGARASGDDAAERRGRSAALAFAFNPVWLLSDARRLLKAATAHPPVDYDVGAGLARHRELASAPAAMPSQPPGVAGLGAAGHASAGAGLVGVGAAGVAAIGALAAALLLHSSPRPQPPLDDAPPPQRIVATSTPRADTPSAVAPTPIDVPPPVAPSSPAPSTPLPVAAHRVTYAGTSPAASVHDARIETAPAVVPSETPPVASNSQLEAQEIARAERLLATNPSSALAIVRGARSQFKSSFLVEERDYVEVMALHALGRSDDARAAAKRFMSSYPGSAFGNRVRGVLAK
ncbi:MAG TPA: RNA polymerase sigma factor [Polyangiaceae bacterium]|jgi:RNA polymerase sigma-70 factor (ECF subfamily)|nr:RNA polymerase sigma factor [Polyangiaceae bacterium]